MENETISENKPQNEISEKSDMIALILAFIFGALGAHRFYAGRIKSAILMLLITLFIVAVWLIPSFLKEPPQALIPFIIGLGFVMVILRLFLGIWILIDIIMIFLGRFKDKEGKLIKY